MARAGQRAVPTLAGMHLAAVALSAALITVAAGSRSSRRPRHGGRRAWGLTICSAGSESRGPSPAIHNVELVCRSFFLSQCPKEDWNLPEISVFGRSNVGKSSLVNFLCNRKLLSTVSKKPGHTKLIHHFLVDQSWYLVDLPGVGFMNASGDEKQAMSRIVAAYVRHRSTLAELLYLVDASVPPQKVDLQGIKWLTDSGVNMSIVFTKSDKPRKVRTSAVEDLSDALWKMEGSPWRLGKNIELPQMMITSSEAKTGRDAVLQHIAEVRQRSSFRVLKRAARRGAESKGEGAGARVRAVANQPPPAIR